MRNACHRDIVTLSCGGSRYSCKCCPAGGIWQQNRSQIKQELRQRLGRSTARWKLVVGHHPIASYGHHCSFSMDGDCRHMTWLEAELQVNCGVGQCGGEDAFDCGTPDRAATAGT
jgi:hypothetical protein